jgi:hypothetical protein
VLCNQGSVTSRVEAGVPCETPAAWFLVVWRGMYHGYMLWTGLQSHISCPVVVWYITS